MLTSRFLCVIQNLPVTKRILVNVTFDFACRIFMILDDIRIGGINVTSISWHLVILLSNNRAVH